MMLIMIGIFFADENSNFNNQRDVTIKIPNRKNGLIACA
jgi:hypothetical protein